MFPCRLKSFAGLTKTEPHKDVKGRGDTAPLIVNISQFRWPYRLRCTSAARSVAGIAGFESRWRHACSSLAFRVCCVGSGLCDELINRTEESYRVCVRACACARARVCVVCVCVCAVCVCVCGMCVWCVCVCVCGMCVWCVCVWYVFVCVCVCVWYMCVWYVCVWCVCLCVVCVCVCVCVCVVCVCVVCVCVCVCASVCDLEIWTVRRATPELGHSATEKRKVKLTPIGRPLCSGLSGKELLYLTDRQRVGSKSWCQQGGERSNPCPCQEGNLAVQPVNRRSNDCSLPSFRLLLFKYIKLKMNF